MSSKQKRQEQIQELLLEYTEYRSKGLSHEEALEEFSYLHAVTLGRLKKHLNENLKEEKGPARKSKSRSL